MAQTPQASKQQHWLQLVQCWQLSRLSVREFCRRHHLSQPSFYAWRRTLQQRGLLTNPPKNIPATAADPPAIPSSAFVKLTLPTEAPTPATVDIVLGQRLLRVRPGFDAPTLLALVRLLEEPAC